MTENGKNVRLIAVEMTPDEVEEKAREMARVEEVNAETREMDIPAATIILKPYAKLIGAQSESRREIHTYDDCDGPLWAYSDPYGIRMIIRARSFEAAYEIMLETTPIEPSEVPEAYGFDGAVIAAESGEYPDLIEGYQYQPNAGAGTGIVSVGPDEMLFEVTPEWLHKTGVRIQIELGAETRYGGSGAE